MQSCEVVAETLTFEVLSILNLSGSWFSKLIANGLCAPHVLQRSVCSTLRMLALVHTLCFSNPGTANALTAWRFQMPHMSLILQLLLCITPLVQDDPCYFAVPRAHTPCCMLCYHGRCPHALARPYGCTQSNIPVALIWADCALSGHI
jgi:hypothetical protein